MKKLNLRIKAEQGEVVCCCLASALVKCDRDCDKVTVKIDDRYDALWCMSHNGEVKLREQTR